jgi:hypothetical protein
MCDRVGFRFGRRRTRFRFSRTNRSILQPEEEAQIEQPSGFTAADHMLGDRGGWRERLFAAGV